MRGTLAALVRSDGPAEGLEPGLLSRPMVVDEMVHLTLRRLYRRKVVHILEMCGVCGGRWIASGCVLELLIGSPLLRAQRSRGRVMRAVC